MGTSANQPLFKACSVGLYWECEAYEPEVHDIVQEEMIKTIPKEKKCKKAKWLSEEALQIIEKRREVKGKGEKEKYIHLMQSSKE